MGQFVKLHAVTAVNITSAVTIRHCSQNSPRTFKNQLVVNVFKCNNEDNNTYVSILWTGKATINLRLLEPFYIKKLKFNLLSVLEKTESMNWTTCSSNIIVNHFRSPFVFLFYFSLVSVFSPFSLFFSPSLLFKHTIARVLLHDDFIRSFFCICGYLMIQLNGENSKLL